MQVSVETTSGLERRMTVEVPKEKIDKEVQARLKSLAGKARISGFRPGKVPMKVIQKRYGGQVQQEVIGEVVQSSFYEALTQEKLMPAGQPQIEPKQMADDATGLEFTAVFEIYPEVTLANASTINIERPVVDINDDDINKMIETIRNQQKTWQEVERGAEKDDRVVIDFEGKIDGEVFDGGAGTAMPVELGTNRMIPGFEDQLLGVKIGDEKTLSLSFPEEYHAKDLAGKPVTFDVKVQKVEEAVLPELDDAFAETMGVKEGGLDAFRSQVKENMQRELDNAMKSKIKQQVMDGLFEQNKFDLPKALVDNEINALIEQQKQTMGKEDLGIDGSIFESQARRRVALGLILSEVIKQNELKVDPSKIRETVEAVASGYEHPEEVVKYYYGDKQRLSEIENYALEEEVVNWVTNNAHVTEKTSNFDEVMNRNNPA